MDLLETPSVTGPEEERFAPLYRVLSKLTRRQRNLVARRFGVGKVYGFMKKHDQLQPGDMATLRRKLAPYLDQIVRRKKE